MHHFDRYYLPEDEIRIKVWTDSSAESGSNPILIDRIQIESAAGLNPSWSFRSAQSQTARSTLTIARYSVYNRQSVCAE